MGSYSISISGAHTQTLTGSVAITRDGNFTATEHGAAKTAVRQALVAAGYFDGGGGRWYKDLNGDGNYTADERVNISVSLSGGSGANSTEWSGGIGTLMGGSPPTAIPMSGSGDTNGGGDTNGTNNGTGNGSGGRRGSGGRTSGGGGTSRTTTSDPSTWTGYPMRIRVKKSDGTWGEWRTIPHGQDNNYDASDAEIRQLLGVLENDDTGDMNAQVQVEYQRNGSWGHADSFDQLGPLYTRAGMVRPGATSGMGNATISYRDGSRTRTVTVQYRLDPNSEGDVSHAEATRIQEIFRNIPGYQSSWRITQVQAEGKTLNAGAWASRLSPDYRSPNSSGTPDDFLDDSLNRGFLARLSRNRQSRRAEQRRLTAMLNNLLRGGRLNWRTFLSYINLSAMRREAVVNESLSWAVQSLSEIEARQGELNTELRGLSSSDRNRYTSSMTRINNELNELSGQRNSIMSFVRDSKSVSDEGKELAKSLYAELQQEEMLMRF